MSDFIKDILERIAILEDAKRQVEKRLDELERNVVSHNGARLIMDDDLRVSHSTTLTGGTLGGNYGDN